MSAPTMVVQWRDDKDELHDTEERAEKANERYQREAERTRKVGAVARHFANNVPPKVDLHMIAEIIVRDWAHIVKAVEWAPPFRANEPWGAVEKLVKEDRSLWMQPEVSPYSINKFIIENWSLLRAIMEPETK